MRIKKKIIQDNNMIINGNFDKQFSNLRHEIVLNYKRLESKNL